MCPSRPKHRSDELPHAGLILILRGSGLILMLPSLLFLRGAIFCPYIFFFRYTEALQLVSEDEEALRLTLYRNRSLVRLKLEEYEGAEADCTLGMKIDIRRHKISVSGS